MMESIPKFSDDQIDAAISGERTGDPRTDDLAADLGSLRRALNGASSGRSQWAHLAAMRTAAKGNTTLSLRHGRRRRFVVAVAAVTGAVGSVSLMGGMAAAGVLPRPVQHAVEAVAGTIGVDVRTPHPPRDLPGVDRQHSLNDPAYAHEVAPGQSGTTPGQSGTTPGQSGTTPGQSGTTPGQSGTTPGQAKHDG